MTAFVLSPEAEEDIWSIWQYLALEAGLSVANRVESTIFDKIAFLSGMPGIGHWRRDLTDEPVRFFAIYSYLVVYRPETRPLQVVAILHSRREVAVPRTSGSGVLLAEHLHFRQAQIILPTQLHPYVASLRAGGIVTEDEGAVV